MGHEEKALLRAARLPSPTGCFSQGQARGRGRVLRLRANLRLRQGLSDLFPPLFKPECDLLLQFRPGVARSHLLGMSVIGQVCRSCVVLQGCGFPDLHHAAELRRPEGFEGCSPDVWDFLSTAPLIGRRQDLFLQLRRKKLYFTECPIILRGSVGLLSGGL